MPDPKFTLAIEKIVAKDKRYPCAAYEFIESALKFTQVKAEKTDGKTRHVTGQELLEGIREYALEQFASMAIVVFEEWGITSCEDFGEIVFNMVDEGILSKTKEDARKDFAGGFDFYEAFSVPFLPPSARGCRNIPLSGNN
jgi:uncharacterized repeat protein (TIGR04138 family)